MTGALANGIVRTTEEDPHGRSPDDVLPAIPSASQMLIHTGNIICRRNFILNKCNNSTDEIKFTASNVMGAWVNGINKHETKFVDIDNMSDNRSHVGTNVTEDRKNLKVTVKLFVVSSGPECVKEALSCVGQKLNTNHVETFILSLPFSQRAATTGTSWDQIGPYWESAELMGEFSHQDASHHSECDRGSPPPAGEPPLEMDDIVSQKDKALKRDEMGPAPPSMASIGDNDVHISWTMGLADLSADSLRDVYEHAHEKPAIDQLNVDTCCSPPEELVSFCKDHDIQLLTHNDPREIFGVEAMNDLLAKHFTHDKDLIGWRVGWIVRYSALVKCRGIIHSKGYIMNLVRDNPDPVLPPVGSSE